MIGEVARTLAKWREANEASRAAENLLAQAWQEHERGGPPPPAELMETVAELRDVATQLLNDAMAAMSRATHGKRK